MWAHPWGAWPLQQSAYQNVPSEQIDWAELAKQWIAQREAMSSGTGVPPPGEDTSQPPPPLQQQPHPQPPQCQPPPPIHQISQTPQSQHTAPPPPPPFPPLPPDGNGPNVVETSRVTGGTGPLPQMLLEHVPHPPHIHPPPSAGENQNEMDISDGENEGSRDSGYKGPAPLPPSQPMPPNLPLLSQPPPSQPMPGDWNWNMGNWSVPPHQSTGPPGWGMQHHSVGDHKETQSYDYGHGNSNFQQSFDYHHGNDQFRYQQVSLPKHQHIPSHGQHIDSGEDNWRHDQNQNRGYRSGRGNRSRSPPKLHIPTSPVDDSGIDATKRKNLPAWIREGLEKMERDKQKKLERERKDKEQIEALKAKENAEKEAEAEVLKERAEGKIEKKEPFSAVKSRFESDEEETIESDAKSPHEPVVVKPEKRSPSPDAYKTEEEKQAELQMKVRRYLTEILLEVTNTEIEAVAKEVYFKARNRAAKAPAKQLAKSTALASLSTLGVGSDSGSDEETLHKPSKMTDDDSDEESDNALHERIRQRQLSRQQRRDSASSDSDTDVGHDQSPAATIESNLDKSSYAFGRKYDKIPGLDIRSDDNEDKNQSDETSLQKLSADSWEDVQKRSKETRTVSKKDSKRGKKSVKKKSSSSGSSSSSSSSSGSSSSSSGGEDGVSGGGGAGGGGGYSDSDSDSSDSSSDSSSSEGSSSSRSSSSADKKRKLPKAFHDDKLLHAYLKKRERDAKSKQADYHDVGGTSNDQIKPHGWGRKGSHDNDRYRRSGSRDSYKSASYDRQHSRGSDRYSTSEKYSRESYESSTSQHRGDRYPDDKYSGGGDKYDKYGRGRISARKGSNEYYERENIHTREGSYSSVGSSKNRLTSKRKQSRSDSSDSDRSSSKRRNTKSSADRWYEQRSERYKYSSRERSDFDRSGKRSSRKHKSRSRSRSRSRYR